MADTGNYGQFGEAVYDHRGRRWRFNRSTMYHYAPKLLGEPKIAIHPSGTSISSSRAADGKEGPSRRREKQVKSLIQTYPELQPASTLLPELARISEAVEETVARHDPAKGNLLSSGSITDEATRRLVDVAAFSCGPTGSDLCIVQFQKQRRGWDDSRKAWLEVPTIYCEEGIWKGLGAPIQSIIFAQPLEHGDYFLAVRLITSTLIFRPILRKAPASVESRCDWNLLFTLHTDQTGGTPHADVAFNPWQTRQFAVVDQASSWSIWELRSRNPGRAKQISHGSLTNVGDQSTKEQLDDSWLRIIWVCNPTIIAVCNRRRLTMFSNGQEEAVELEKVDVGFENGIGLILDAARLPLLPTHLAVLTSTHALVYHIEASGDNRITVKNILKLRHFRSPDDISLRLSVFDDGGGKIRRYQ